MTDPVTELMQGRPVPVDGLEIRRWDETIESAEKNQDCV
jgi:hypothetical protein